MKDSEPPAKPQVQRHEQAHKGAKTDFGGLVGDVLAPTNDGLGHKQRPGEAWANVEKRTVRS